MSSVVTLSWTVSARKGAGAGQEMFTKLFWPFCEMPRLGLELVWEEAGWVAYFLSTPTPALPEQASCLSLGSSHAPPAPIEVGQSAAAGSASPVRAAQQGWLSLPVSAWLCDKQSLEAEVLARGS